METWTRGWTCSQCGEQAGKPSYKYGELLAHCQICGYSERVLPHSESVSNAMTQSFLGEWVEMPVNSQVTWRINRYNFSVEYRQGAQDWQKTDNNNIAEAIRIGFQAAMVEREK